MDDIIQAVDDAHYRHCPYTDAKIQELDGKPLLHSMIHDEDSIATADDLELEKVVIWSHLASQLSPSIKPLILFSCSIPGFQKLSLHDKICCIKFGFFEIWLIHVSPLVNYQDGTVTFCNGYYISKQQLEIIYDKEFVSMLFNFSGCLNDLQLSDTVRALYSALVLHNAERYGIRDPLPLQRMRAKYVNYLRYQLQKEQQLEVFDILVAMLPELQTIGQKHLQYVKQIWADSSSQIEMPTLMAEVFDFIKDEKDIMQLFQETNVK